MTRIEHDTFEEAPCPCGTGHVLRHVQSTDYRYSSVHISYSIDCSLCASQWRIEHGNLILRASEAPYLAAKGVSDSARRELHQLAEELVRSHLSTKSFKSKKAELEYLLALDLSTATYASYLKSRREGKSMHQLAFGPRNISWLKERAQASGKMAEFVELLHNHEVMSQSLEVAYRQIVRRSIKGD